GSQSAVWSFQIEHLGFTGGLLLAALLALLQRRLGPPRAHWTAWSAATATVLAGTASFIVLLHPGSLPVLLDRTLADPTPQPFHTISWIIATLDILAVALSLLAARIRSRARVWLLLAVFVTLVESIQELRADDRYTAGWYLGRGFGMAGFVLLLVVLILEVLRQSRELVERRAESLRLAQVVEQSPMSQYITDNEMHVLDINEAFTRFTGFTREELVGKPLPLIPDPGNEKLAESLLERLRTRAAESVSMRVQVPRKSKPAVCADWTAHALLDASGDVIGNAGSFVDASAAMAMDLDFRVPVGVGLVSSQFQFMQVNTALSNLTGRSMMELLGTALLDVLHADDKAAVSELCSGLATGTSSSGNVECRLAHQDGASVWVLLYAARLVAPDGGFEGATLQVIDVNERKLAEQAAQEAEREISFRAHFDHLTGLMNHQSFVDCIDASLHTVEAEQHVAAVMMDIDGFQAVSNSLTRQQGDDVLREFGELVAAHVGSRDRVARLGADEFGLVIIADNVEIAQQVQRLMRVIAEHGFGASGQHIYLTASVGVSLSHSDAVAADMVQEADMAMRQAQRRGRGHWQLFTHEYRAEVNARVNLTRELHDALRLHEFHAWYMPIVRLNGRSVDGFEALVRWQSSTGIRAPDLFLGVAEETGQIVDIGSQVFEQAVAKLQELPSHLRMAVNASPMQLLRGDVFLHIEALLAASGVEASRLVVEITEQSLFESKRASDANLFQLAELGVGIHVDDFGTGYSSVTHLRDFPITGLKLDTSFTAGLDKGHTRSIEIAGILGELTHRLGLEGIAEGVETETQAAKLEELGWTFGQGWLFGKASPEPQLLSVI
ncbi:MAG: sensor domain-containing protein, partial [Candidatus Nanopelagicales bacterium]